ncbi:Piso0_001059 [Millerozyma farinosa CBS 7064]|uniref:Eukaryotic translation initiation factor 3 subunit J n=1 Tax=Pichia sorbitophila (strain ATCC MYA-4447 / BCRC 22081 / CBS 7064 / NBRC 10061 / NRRL Y-12695) TaxID=559304 RepID=G8YS99_PICSO|nr:Piso0_001059 [Millerozyma farinosa CBS 7064]CCE79022.1 Piso0_001059 [Millerozyma farinosa CBS 7064]
MSWEDEDFDVGSKSQGAVASWEDEEDDGPLLDSWDVDEEEEKRKKAAEEAKKRAEKEALKKKQEEAKAKKNASKKGDKALLDIDKLDEKTRQEMLKKAELSSDLNNAADLFGGLGVNDDINEHPRERAARLAAGKEQSKPAALTKDTPLEDHPLFQPVDKKEFEKLRKALSATLTKLAEDSLLNYSSSLAVDLIRDVAQPLTIENTRKVISTLNVILKDKERAERQARLKKTGGTATGGAGKKKAKPAVNTNVDSFKKDVFDDVANSKYDNFDDDDFM